MIRYMYTALGGLVITQKFINVCKQNTTAIFRSSFMYCNEIIYHKRPLYDFCISTIKEDSENFVYFVSFVLNMLYPKIRG